MIAKKAQERGNPGKIIKTVTALALVSVFCLGPIIQHSRVHDSIFIQKLDLLGSGELNDRLLLYFTPKLNYRLSAAGTSLQILHSATIPVFDYSLPRPSLTCLTESDHGRFHAAIFADSAIKIRAPPSFLLNPSIL